MIFENYSVCQKRAAIGSILLFIYSYVVLLLSVSTIASIFFMSLLLRGKT